MTEDDDLWDLAESIKLKYMLLFQHFSDCHKLYNRASRLSPQDVGLLEESINNLVSYYVVKFSNFSFTPKFHLLYKHVVPFIRRTGIGLGFMAEQGGEQLHAQFNTLRKRLVGIQNVKDMPPELALLRAIMEEHLIRVYPANRRNCEE